MLLLRGNYQIFSPKKVLHNEGANFKLMNKIVALFLNRKYNIEVKMGGLLSNKNEELFLKL